MKEENFNFIEEEPKIESKGRKRKFWKFAAVFLVIIAVLAAGLIIWNEYFSPSARNARQTEENYRKILQVQTNYEEAMGKDTYGGKTPEGTLKMFAEALKKGDIDLAGRYFSLEDDGSANSEWLKGLEEKKSSGGLEELISIVESAKKSSRDTGSSDIAEYVVINSGKVDYSIELKLNKFSQIWKIESL